MQHFKLGFRNRTVQEQLGICEKVIAGFANLPEEQRTCAQNLEATATVDALRASDLRVGILRGELAAEITRRAGLLRTARGQVTRCALRTSGHVGADAAQLLASGLDLAKPTTVRHGRGGAPENLRAEAHAMEGVVKLRWEHPMRRAVFTIEFRAESSEETDWKQCEVCAKRSCVVQGLTSGVKYLFRVRAHNAHGAGPWSNPARVRVR